MRIVSCSFLTLLACVASSPGRGPLDRTGASEHRLTYFDVQQKSTHNSYARHEGLADQMMYHRVRSLELDLHAGKFRQPELIGNWYVYHTDAVDDDTSCRTLVDCFESVHAFRDAAPDHEVITLWLDLKDDWREGHSPKELDALLDASFGDDLVTPAELMKGCPDADSVLEAVEDPACGWPPLAQLNGRVIVGLTGGGVSSATDRLARYLREGSLAFAAPSVDHAEAADSLPDTVAIANVGLCTNNTASALGFDCDVGSDALAAISASVASSRVVRAWGIDSEASWGAALDSGAHHLGTDLVNYERHAWAVTHGDHGWPFSCSAGCDAEPESNDVVRLDVLSGDLWNEEDSFALVGIEAAAEAEWTAMVSTANSHVEDFAKGCLMARTSKDEDSPYFAICRPADAHRARIQYRASRGKSTKAIEHAGVPGASVDPTSVAWLRLVVNDAGHCASGYAGLRRGEWVRVGSYCFGEPLRLQGFAASAHDADDPVGFVFAAPSRNRVPVQLADMQLHEIGATLTVSADPVP